MSSINHKFKVQTKQPLLQDRKTMWNVRLNQPGQADNK